MFAPLKNPLKLKTPYQYCVAWHASTRQKRDTEFAAGRFCAAQALERCRPGMTTEIGKTKDGLPAWPKGIVGSITHTKGFASTAIAQAQKCLSIGIDAEELRADPNLSTLVPHILSNDEQALLKTLPYSFPESTLLFFSAKESIYKCLYPLIRRRFDFSAVLIHAVTVQEHSFCFSLTESLHKDFQKGFQAQGTFAFAYDCVHTAVEITSRA